MVALKSSEIDAFVARPDPARPVVLVFGPDAGLVRERVEALVRGAVDDPADPFALVRLDGDSIDAGRLAEEAHTVPLFGGRRAVWVKAGRSNLAAAVETVTQDPPGGDCRIIIEAGDLKRDSGLRTVCEKARSAVALPCYADAGEAVARVIDREMQEAGLSITGDARAMLVSLLGGDRLATRSEVRKLALYAHGRGRVDTDDVMAVIADASALAQDGIVDATFAGKVRDFDREFARARAAGTHPGVILSAALRHTVQLHRARLAIDGGRPLPEALRAVIGSFFKREAAVRGALTAWTAPRLAQLMTDLADANAAARRRPAMAEAIAHRALLTTAQRARRGR